MRRRRRHIKPPLAGIGQASITSDLTWIRLRHHLHPDGARLRGLRVPHGRAGLAQPPRARPPRVHTIETDVCIDALQEAITRCGKPEIVKPDQGSQFTSSAFIAMTPSARPGPASARTSSPTTSVARTVPMAANRQIWCTSRHCRNSVPPHEHGLPIAAVVRSSRATPARRCGHTWTPPSLQGLSHASGRQEEVADIHPTFRRAKRFGPDGSNTRDCLEPLTHLAGAVPLFDLALEFTDVPVELR
jgi:hypothetical protein